MTTEDLKERARNGEADVVIICNECGWEYIGAVGTSAAPSWALDECPECGSGDLDVEEA